MYAIRSYYAIMDAGCVLAQGTPAYIRRLTSGEQGLVSTMEDAFITVVEQARRLESTERAASRGAA